MAQRPDTQLAYQLSAKRSATARTAWTCPSNAQAEAARDIKQCVRCDPRPFHSLTTRTNEARDRRPDDDHFQFDSNMVHVATRQDVRRCLGIRCALYKQLGSRDILIRQKIEDGVPRAGNQGRSPPPRPECAWWYPLYSPLTQGALQGRLGVQR